MARLTPLVQGLPSTVPFVGPETQERARGAAFIARLGANESVFGPAPSAIAAMRDAAAEVWRYGDPEAHDLRHAIAAHHGVDPAHVMIGEGIDGLLGMLVRLLVETGTPVVTSRGAYPTFAYHVAGFGGALHAVPYRRDAQDLTGLARAARDTGAVLVYLANPDNPTGSWHAAGDVAALLSALPAECLLCLDEAYADFAPQGAIPPLDCMDARVIRMRTFSKAHGMAGARIGYALGAPELIAAFDRVRNHFGVNRIAQAGARAALADHSWLAHVVREVGAARGHIAEIARAQELTVLPSATNFVTIDCGRDGAFARRVVSGLIARGIFVRMPFVAPQDRCIRVSAGGASDLDAFAAGLPEALAAARSSGD